MGCEFCLSAIEASVRLFPLEPILIEITHLLGRGCRHFKFADRSLNLVPDHYDQVLRFFLARPESDLGVHVEIVPDRLSRAQLELARRFAPGVLQFEMGIQTFNPRVAEHIHRHQNMDRIVEVMRWLRTETKVHLHADLIAGLPGETLESLGQGFDQLVALRPQEIQLGVLKRLRGSLIQRHDQEWQMVFNPEAPYDLLHNRLIDFATVQRLKRMARYWDLIANNGNFLTSYPLIWQDQPSPFQAFLAFSDWLFQQTKRHHGIALNRLAEWLWTYLTEVVKRPVDVVGKHLAQDYWHCGRLDPPPFLKAWAIAKGQVPDTGTHALKRQQRHLNRPPQDSPL
jgi:radical SAM superfamily enzyme YgiQ (UPF0313 family)